MTTSFEIENLKCEGCVSSATNGVKNIENISNVVVTLEKNTISFETDAKEKITEVINKLKELGYPKKAEISLLEKAKSYLNSQN